MSESNAQKSAYHQKYTDRSAATNVLQAERELLQFDNSIQQLPLKCGSDGLLDTLIEPLKKDRD